MDGELLSLKWNNHRTTFYHVISGLRNKESYTDVTLACDGKFYPVHKLVLSTCSEYFNDIFDRTPCKNPVVVLKDIQCRDLEFLLDYMYIGEVNVRQNELTSLIKAAECLRVKGLAVPDEEPKKGGSASSVNSVPQSSSRQRPEHSSPPAKRRRGEERRVNPVSSDHSPGRPPGDGRQSSPDYRDAQPSHSSDAGRRLAHFDDVLDVDSEETPIVIKEEKQDMHDNITDVQNSFDVGGDDNGDGPHDTEGSTSDFPEFLQSTIEKEEPVAINDYNPDFAGPSGLQNSGLAPWEGENSSAGFPEGLSGAVAAAVAAVSQPQQQRQQQQLISGSGSFFQPTTSNTNLVMPGNSIQEEEATCTGIYTCSFCGYEACSRADLKIHIDHHTAGWQKDDGQNDRAGWPYACTQCDYMTRRSHDLKRHVLSRHVGEVLRPFRCQFCPYRTTHSVHLTAHIVKKHPLHTEYLVPSEKS